MCAGCLWHESCEPLVLKSCPITKGSFCQVLVQKKFASCLKGCLFNAMDSWPFPPNSKVLEIYA